MESTSGSKALVWTGRVISTLIVLLLLMGVAMSFSGSKEAAEGTAKFGYPTQLMPILGTVELICALLYAIPKTSIFGAILLTGYLGGAVATHVRLEDPMFVVAVIVGILAWLALYFREPRLRALVPLRS
jgi:Mn2+/Fe2+ NRAMP family transporter